MALLLPPASQAEKSADATNTSANEEETTSPSLSKEDIRLLLAENNDILSLLIQENMDLLLKAQEMREEDRYRNLDTLIRNQQEYRRESAKSGLLGKFHRFMEV